jgi:hypothetical protein
MPIRRIPPVTSEKYSELLEELKRELQFDRPARGLPTQEPYIIEEQDIRGNGLNVAVVWDSWERVPPNERGGLILDAYKAIRGETTMLSIRVALGLTRSEARKLGIYDLLAPGQEPAE